MPPPSRSKASKKTVKREGALVAKGLTNAAVRAVAERVENVQGALGTRQPYFLGGPDNIRRYNEFGPVEYKDAEGREYRRDGADEWLYRMPKSLTHAKNVGYNDVSFPSPDDELTLTAVDSKRTPRELRVTVESNLSLNLKRAVGRIRVQRDEGEREDGSSA